MPVVSPKPISSAPAAISRRAIAKTRSGGTWPSYGQPKATEITPSQRSPSARARAITRSSPLSDSSIERLTFSRLCVSEAERKTLISWKRSRWRSAMSSPRSFGISTDRATPAGGSIAASTSPASASCGITSGRTKLVTSSRRRPVRASWSISRTLSAVAITSGSFWKPSRGPTSRMRTCWTEVLTSAQSRVRPLMTDSVTVIGASGALGYGLALRLGIAGTPIVIGSRDAGRSEETAAKLAGEGPDGAFEGFANGEAAQRSEVVFLCVPFRNQSETLTNLKEHLREGQLVVDATVPLAAAVSGRATRMLGVWQGSAAQQAAEMVPDGVRVVSALHTVSAASLRDPDAALDEDILVCGDKKADKRRVAEIVERIPGLRCVDCGRLEQSRTTESLTALLIGINSRYKTHAGIRVTGLPDALWQPPS